MKYFFTSFFCVMLLGFSVFCGYIVYINSESVFTSDEAFYFELPKLQPSDTATKHTGAYTTTIITATTNAASTVKDAIKDFFKKFIQTY